MLPKIPAVGEEDEVRKEGRLGKKDLLFPPQLLKRLKDVAVYVQSSDTDAIVRTHAHDCSQHLDALEVDLVQYDLNGSR